MHKYTPRRAGQRWLACAPEYVLDVFDDARTPDRYTVLFCGSMLERQPNGDILEINYLGMSSAPDYPQGFSQWGSLTPYEATAYRYRNTRFRIKWMSLPEHIRKHVMARAEKG